MIDNLSQFQVSCLEIREKIISTAYKTQSGNHFGSALSIVEILNYIYTFLADNSLIKSRSPFRDRVILSKGHAVLALITTLHHHGLLSDSDLSKYKTFNSKLIAHPIRHPEFSIESTNGSLGHGLSFAVGLAHGLKTLQSDAKVYVIIGDGECNEGSIWEATMSAVQLKLDNLFCVIDNNGFQSDDSTELILTSSNLFAKFQAFGCDTYSINGHEEVELARAFEISSHVSSAPHFIVANTVKGKGVSFMESDNSWHHNTLSATQYHQVLTELLTSK